MQISWHTRCRLVSVLWVGVANSCSIGSCVITVSNVRPIGHLLRIKHFRGTLNVWISKSCQAVVSYFHFSRLSCTRFCGINHHAVGCSCTIDRGRRGIFKNGYRLNIIRIDEIGIFSRHPINNVKRSVSTKSTKTTNTNLTCCSWLAIGKYSYTRYTSL